MGKIQQIAEVITHLTQTALNDNPLREGGHDNEEAIRLENKSIAWNIMERVSGACRDTYLTNKSNLAIENAPGEQLDIRSSFELDLNSCCESLNNAIDVLNKALTIIHATCDKQNGNADYECQHFIQPRLELFQTIVKQLKVTWCARSMFFLTQLKRHCRYNRTLQIKDDVWSLIMNWLDVGSGYWHPASRIGLGVHVKVTFSAYVVRDSTPCSPRSNTGELSTKATPKKRKVEEMESASDDDDSWWGNRHDNLTKRK